MRAPEANFDVAVIVNCGPYSQTVEQTYGRFKIDACPKELPYTVLVIRPAREQFDLGDDRKGTEWWEPRAIANDIVKSNGLAKLGIFVAAGTRPTQAEVDAAKAGLEAWYHQLVSEGDAFYAANRDVARNGITDNHRKAVLYFGHTREWAYVPSKMVACDFCQEMVRPGATMCKHCNAVLSVDKAIAAGLITTQQGDVLRKHRKKVKADDDAAHRGVIEAPRVAGEAYVGPAPAGTQEALERNRRARAHETQPDTVGLDEAPDEVYTPRPESPEWQTVDGDKE